MSDIGILQQPQIQGALAQPQLPVGALASPAPMTYDTKLTPIEEAKFLKQFPDPRSTADYDMRGAWKAGATKADNGHLPDTWKKPNHITFSNESMYHGVNGNVGGSWQELPGGKWSFSPSTTNLKNTPLPQMQQYFQRYEPGNMLVLPK